MSKDKLVLDDLREPVAAAALGVAAYAVAYGIAGGLVELGVAPTRLNVLGPLVLFVAGWLLVDRLDVAVDEPRDAALLGLGLVVGFGGPLLAVVRLFGAVTTGTPSGGFPPGQFPTTSPGTPTAGGALATPFVLASRAGAAVAWPLAFGGLGALAATLEADHDLSGTARDAVGTAPRWSLPAGAAAYVLAYAVATALLAAGVTAGLSLLGPAALLAAGWAVADRNGLGWRGAETAVAAAAVGLALLPGFAALLLGAAALLATPAATLLATPVVLSSPVLAAVAWSVALGAAGALLAVLDDEHDLRATGADALGDAPAASLLGGVTAFVVAYFLALALYRGLGVTAGLALLAPAALLLSGLAVADRNGHRWRGRASLLGAVAVGLALLAGFAGTVLVAATALPSVVPGLVDPAVASAVVDPLVLGDPLHAAVAWPLAFGTAGAVLSALDATYGFEETARDATLDAPAWSLPAGVAAYAAAYGAASLLQSVLGVTAGLALLAPAALVLAGWVVADRNGHRWRGAGTGIAAAAVGAVALAGFLPAALVGTRVLGTPVATALATPLVLGNDAAAAVAWPLVFGGAGAVLYAYHGEYGLVDTARGAVGDAPQWSLPAGAAAYLLALAVAAVLRAGLGVTMGLHLLAPAALVLAGWVVADRNGLRARGAESVVGTVAVGLALLPGFAALAVAVPRLLAATTPPLLDAALAVGLLRPVVLPTPLQAALAWPVAFGAAGAAARVLDDRYDYANRESAVAFVRRAPWPGAVLGAVAFLAGYHALVVVASAVVPAGGLGFLPLDLGIPPGETVGGWLYYNLHGVGIHAPTGIDASFGITTTEVGVGDLSVTVPDGFDASANVREGSVYLFGRGPASLLRLVPGAVLALAGAVAAAVGNRLGERSVRASLADGAALAVGFAPPFVLRASRLDHRVAVVFQSREVGLGIFGIGDVEIVSFSIYVVRDVWFYAGAVALPLVFGAAGALAWLWRSGRL